MKVINVLAPDSKGPYTVQEMKVVSLDVDTKPSETLFQLELVAGVQINRVGVLEWTTLKKDQVVSFKDVPAIHEKMIKNGEAYKKSVAK